MCHINNSVSWKWKNPSNAKNSPKTNTYPKYYEVSNKFYVATATNTVSPNPWLSVFTTQVNILILTTYNILPKSLLIASQVNFCAFEIGSVTCDCIPLGSGFWNIEQANWYWEACSTRCLMAHAVGWCQGPSVLTVATWVAWCLDLLNTTCTAYSSSCYWQRYKHLCFTHWLLLIIIVSIMYLPSTMTQ